MLLMKIVPLDVDDPLNNTSVHRVLQESSPRLAGFSFLLFLIFRCSEMHNLGRTLPIQTASSQSPKGTIAGGHDHD